MNGILPEGLISISSTQPESVPSDPADLKYLNLRALHNFWKVYATQSRLSRSAADERSRNLFWRVWSNPLLSHSIPPQTIQDLWASCDGEFELTPFRLCLPDTDTCFNEDADNIKSPTGQHATEVNGSRGLPNDPRRDHDPPSRCSEPNLRSPSHRFLPTDSTSSSKQLETFTRSRQSSLELSEDSISQAALPSKPALNRSSSGGKRGPVVAGVARVRHRPSLGRRKSSQTSVNRPADPPKSPKPILKSPLKSPLKISEVVGDAGRSQGYPFPASTARSPFTPPAASSWQDVDDNHTAHASGMGFHDATGALVDRDFRGRFAERIASSSSLAIVNKMQKTGSVVRFADEVPTELRKGKDRRQSSSSEEEYTTDTGRSLTHRGSLASQAISDSDEDDVVELPRTRSQLSLAIQNMRGESDESGFARRGGLTATKKPGTKTEEEKLLSMGRKDGVTKAGGVQIARPHRLSERPPPRHESPSPPPLF